MTKEEIRNIAEEYAKKFTKTFLELATDSWYYDALDWFDYEYGTEFDEDGMKCVSDKERDIFASEISKLYEDRYEAEYGLIDDYYYLKGIIGELNSCIERIMKIKKKYSPVTHPIEISDDTIGHLIKGWQQLIDVRNRTNSQLKIEE